MKRLFFFCISLILAFSLYRATFDAKPLTFQAFLKALSSLHLEFTITGDLMETIRGFGAFASSANSLAGAIGRAILVFPAMLIAPLALLGAVLFDFLGFIISFGGLFFKFLSVDLF